MKIMLLVVASMFVAFVVFYDHQEAQGIRRHMKSLEEVVNEDPDTSFKRLKERIDSETRAELDAARRDGGIDIFEFVGRSSSGEECVARGTTLDEYTSVYYDLTINQDRRKKGVIPPNTRLCFDEVAKRIGSNGQQTTDRIFSTSFGGYSGWTTERNLRNWNYGD